MNMNICLKAKSALNLFTEFIRSFEKINLKGSLCRTKL